MSEIWTSIVRNLEGKLDPKELKTWFGPTRQLSFDRRGESGALTVSVPSAVFAEWIGARHGALLAREAAAAGFPGLAIQFLVWAAPFLLVFGSSSFRPRPKARLP